MATRNNRSPKLSDKELAEAYVFPYNPTKASEKAFAEFTALRKKKLLEETPREKMLSRLLQLRFEMEDYLNTGRYEPLRSFPFFLNEYLKVIDRRKKDFADEIDVHETRLSQILNERVEPNEEFIIRLELHSNNIFPALYWFKLLEKKRAYELANNKKARSLQFKHVKRLEVRL